MFDPRTTYSLFSVSNPSNFETWAAMSDLPIARLKGARRGVPGPAYAIRASLFHAVRAAGFMYDQNVVLEVGPAKADGSRDAYMMPARPTGAFVRTTEAHAATQEGASFDPHSSTWWIVETPGMSQHV